MFIHISLLFRTFKNRNLAHSGLLHQDYLNLYYASNNERQIFEIIAVCIKSFLSVIIINVEAREENYSQHSNYEFQTQQQFGCFRIYREGNCQSIVTNSEVGAFLERANTPSSPQRGTRQLQMMVLCESMQFDVNEILDAKMVLELFNYYYICSI